MRFPSLIEACADPMLLGRDLTLRPRQIEWAQWYDEGPKIAAIAAARRSGKTLFAAAATIHNAALRPDLDRMMLPGSMRSVLVVSVSLEQSRQLIREARAMVARSPLIAPLLVGENLDSLTFGRDGARCQLRAIPASAASVRGTAASLVIFEEAAQHRSAEGGIRTLDELWRSLTPAAIQFGERARICMISTPGAPDLFKRIYEEARDDVLPGAAAFHATAYDNPDLTEEDLQAERRYLGEAGSRWFAPCALRTESRVCCSAA